MTMAAKMKGFKKRTLALGVVAAWGLFSAQAQADQLADIKAAGVVKVATFDANPPFGSIDAKTHEIVGYDVDFAKALATSLGVKLELVATNPANRIPLLQSGKADLIVADITITPERAQVIDFSTPYFVTGQQFLVPAVQLAQPGGDGAQDERRGRWALFDLVDPIFNLVVADQ